MNKILLSLGTIALVAAVGIGGTVAYFSDVETSSQNTFAAGTLDLGLGNSAGLPSTGDVTQTWSTTNWAPGETQSGTLYVHNAGSVAAAHAKVVFNYGEVTGGINTVDMTNASRFLPDAIIASTATWNGNTVTAIQGKTLKQLKENTAGYILSGVDANAEKPLNIVWTFDSAADNMCQNKTVTATVTVTLTQD